MLVLVSSPPVVFPVQFHSMSPEHILQSIPGIGRLRQLQSLDREHAEVSLDHMSNFSSITVINTSEFGTPLAQTNVHFEIFIKSGSTNPSTILMFFLSASKSGSPSPLLLYTILLEN